ncbi:hypothetical protein N8612_03415, partial [Verrucomicrobia bacterium]|nr:hypothetical protein [Verrucomicrobiota bacterium]
PGDVPQKESKDDSSQSVSNDVEEEKTMSPVVFNSLLFSAIFGCGALGAGVFLLRRRPDAY